MRHCMHKLIIVNTEYSKYYYIYSQFYDWLITHSCLYSVYLYVDVNECAGGGVCNQNQVCKNTYGSYECTTSETSALQVTCAQGLEVDSTGKQCRGTSKVLLIDGFSAFVWRGGLSGGYFLLWQGSAGKALKGEGKLLPKLYLLGQLGCIWDYHTLKIIKIWNSVYCLLSSVFAVAS